MRTSNIDASAGSATDLLTTNNKQLTTFIERGEIEIKGKGMMRTWFLE